MQKLDEQIDVRRRHTVSDHAIATLGAALLTSHESLRQRIESGQYRLLEVDDGRAYCVVELRRPRVIVHYYGGRDMARFAVWLRNAARAEGCTELVFETRKRAIGRLLRGMKPELCGYRYRIGV